MFHGSKVTGNYKVRQVQWKQSPFQTLEKIISQVYIDVTKSVNKYVYLHIYV